MDKQQEFETYLDEQIAACKQRSRLLAGDDRVDEGNFEKIRANVYEIFRTILSVAEKTYGKDDFAKRRFLFQKAEQIPANWAASYERAKQNGDAEKMHIESLKLGAAREIRERCMQIWGEAV